jgi:hypothetical protein
MSVARAKDGTAILSDWAMLSAPASSLVLIYPDFRVEIDALAVI